MGRQTYGVPMHEWDGNAEKEIFRYIEKGGTFWDKTDLQKKDRLAVP